MDTFKEQLKQVGIDKREIAEACDVSLATVRRWASQRGWPKLGLGRNAPYSRDAVLKDISRQK